MWSALYMVAAPIPGAQTERRGGAGPAGGLLGGKDPTGRFVSQSGPGPASVDSFSSVLHEGAGADTPSGSPSQALRLHLPRRGDLAGGQGRVPVGHLPLVQPQPLLADFPGLLLVVREGEGLPLELDGPVEVPGLGV